MLGLQLKHVSKRGPWSLKTYSQPDNDKQAQSSLKSFICFLLSFLSLHQNTKEGPVIEVQTKIASTGIPAEKLGTEGSIVVLIAYGPEASHYIGY